MTRGAGFEGDVLGLESPSYGAGVLGLGECARAGKPELREECSGRRPVDEGQGGRFSGGFAWRGCTEYSVRRK